MTFFLPESFKEIKNVEIGNNRIFTYIDKSGKKFLLKKYFRDKNDAGKRLETEFSSLKFLWKKGIRRIPRPIDYDVGENLAVYEYIDGHKIKNDEVAEGDIDQATDFLKQLFYLAKDKNAGILPFAAEANFSVIKIIKNLKKRQIKLQKIRKKGLMYEYLNLFLKDKFIPLLSEMENWIFPQLKKENISVKEEIKNSNRTLSPSDFGFHNCLRREDGKIYFLDFEYFGFDDPAKLIADFILHPKMKLRRKLKQRFFKNMLTVFSHDKKLERRLRITFPLFGLKWTLIFLNEYIPENLSRREFARGYKLERNNVLKTQLAKADQLVEKLRNHYRDFKYWV